MKAEDIQALMNEPACAQNKKSKSGCAKPAPGATQGGCCFDGARNALLPIADVAHIVHGPIGCAGSSWDNRGTRSSGPDTLSDRHDDGPLGDGRDHGPRREATVPGDPPGGGDLSAGGGVRLQHLRARLAGRRHRGGRQGGRGALWRAGGADRLRRLLRQQEPRQPGRRRCGLSPCHRNPRARPGSRRTGKARRPAPRRQSDRRVERRRRVLERGAAVRRTGPAHPVHLLRRCRFREVQTMHRAEANMVVCSKAMLHVARKLRDRLGHAVLRRQLLRRRDTSRGLSRLRTAAGRSRSDRAAPKRSSRARKRASRPRSPPCARSSRQARADLHRRLQVVVGGVRHAGSRHGRRRDRHGKIDRRGQGAHPRTDGSRCAHDLRQRSDRL